jgi:hypothetical protein
MTFETWWGETGQETLYALNTLTDADAKVLAEIAWQTALEEAAKVVLADAFAMSFQSMGQYRTALAAAIRARGEK